MKRYQVIIGLYVDDILVIGETGQINCFKNEITTMFKVIVYENVTDYVG